MAGRGTQIVVAYVLDASIAACWCFRDEEHPLADAARDLLESQRAVVPLHWWFEIRNVILLSERRRRVTEQEAAHFLGRLERLPIDLAGLPNPTAVLMLARRQRLTFCDAAYLELAQRARMALATLDQELARAATAEGVDLIAKSS